METESEGLSPIVVPFDFRGEGLEYFKIWIVNLFLTIITIGIYGPWAKVRNTKYLYNNCYLDGQNFDFHADPLSILLGRALALGLFLLLSGVSQVYPVWGSIILILVGLAFLPWLVIKSLRFRARNTSYRNIRFNFDGRYPEAILVFGVLPILGSLSLGLLWPYAIYRLRRFTIEHASYGTTSFDFDATGMDYFWTILKIFGIAVLLIFVVGLLSALSPIIGGILLLVAYPLLFALFEAALSNLQFNSTLLGLNNFDSDLEVKELAIIYAVNALAIAFTLGLFLPVAKIRVARYRASRLQFVAAEDLDGFIGKETEQVSALGEEMGELLDFDLGF